MQSSFHLRIQEPCHENWENMTPDEQGRFCAACQKQVVDFTAMSDRELAGFFKKSSADDVCGRFQQEQLERPIETPSKHLPWFRYLIQLLLPGMFVTDAVAQQVMGKPGADTLQPDPRVRVVPDNRVLGMVAVSAIKPVCELPVKPAAIRGRVTNEEGEPVPYATVYAGVAGQFIADSLGYFILDQVADPAKKVVTLLITAAGYDETRVAIPEQKVPDTIEIVLKEKPPLPQVELISYPFIKGKVTVMGPVQQVSADALNMKPVLLFTENTAAASMLHVFPNPARAGQALHISLDKPAEGYYELQFFQLSGQLVNQQELWIDGDARVFTIQAPMTAAGNYLIYLIHRQTGKKRTAQIVLL